MFTVKAEGLTKELHGVTVVKDVNLEVQTGEKVALIGANGVGKTTLLKILMGELTQDKGKIHRCLPLTFWGLLEQNPDVEEHCTLLQFVQAGSPERHLQLMELRVAESKLSTVAEGQLEEPLARYARCLEQYQASHGYEWEREVEQTLTRLGLLADLYQTPYIHLSGGQKTRAQLARVIVSQPKFLLLDEPTNHLDHETLDWLAKWLDQYKGSILLVSHDRWFIDQTVDVVVELTREGTRRYKGGYTNYRKERDRENREQEALHKKQVQEQKKLDEAIQRYRDWFHQAHAAAGERNPFYKKKANKHQSRFRAKEEALKRLEKEMKGAPVKDPRIRVNFSGRDFNARTLLRTKEMGFSYGREYIFEDVSLTLHRGERLGIVGVNGSGKTTLLRCLIGDLQPSKGEIHLHPELTVGYFAQELEGLDPRVTVLDSLLHLPGMTRAEAGNILASFLFRGGDVYRRIGELSMGEKSRVAFLHLYFSEADLIVLDEPTNYLDIPTRERIEDALVRYPGSLLLVSHDRRFIERVTNRTAIVENGSVEMVMGSYDEYLAYQREKENRHPDLEQDNRIRLLELELAQLVSRGENSDAGAEEELWREIRRVQGEINEAKN
ncbi:ATPase components of ABC transporters with duplicated ATPase domains [Marininema mesophilum]|uniref:ATPase components of ABC transporters with duplicated ATPase domains n=1 Tax=Marininema mesophilum TaxID=1048340 RepID=A0A1H2ZYQ7_9BACL|nr:ABC-F type ribosomal protection protein [Marininema mesophilum]SDX22577.1 ATPase components of ABC transporters with duplicated ATPase domains [Marininema mesophilum]